MTFIIVLFIWLIKRCLRVTAPRATGGGTRCFGDAMCPPPPPPGSDGARTPSTRRGCAPPAPWVSARRPRQPARGGRPGLACTLPRDDASAPREGPVGNADASRWAFII